MELETTNASYEIGCVLPSDRVSSSSSPDVATSSRQPITHMNNQTFVRIVFNRPSVFVSVIVVEFAHSHTHAHTLMHEREIYCVSKPTTHWAKKKNSTSTSTASRRNIYTRALENYTHTHKITAHIRECVFHRCRAYIYMPAETSRKRHPKWPMSLCRHSQHRVHTHTRHIACYPTTLPLVICLCTNAYVCVCALCNYTAPNSGSDRYKQVSKKTKKKTTENNKLKNRKKNEISHQHRENSKNHNTLTSTEKSYRMCEYFSYPTLSFAACCSIRLCCQFAPYHSIQSQHRKLYHVHLVSVRHIRDETKRNKSISRGNDVRCVIYTNADTENICKFIIFGLIFVKSMCLLLCYINC